MFPDKSRKPCNSPMSDGDSEVDIIEIRSDSNSVIDDEQAISESCSETLTENSDNSIDATEEIIPFY